MYRDFYDRRRMFKSSLLLTEQKIDRGRKCNRTSTRYISVFDESDTFHFVIVPVLLISQITELDANANRSGMKTTIGNILFFPPAELKQTNPRFALIREKHELFRLRINSWPLETEPRYLRFGDTGWEKLFLFYFFDLFLHCIFNL